MAVTRDDVARLAGFSTAVVSYVMNDGPRPVAPATRERILAAIEELGYRPNALARNLRRATTDVLGLIVPDITNPFFAELALSIENAAFSRGFSLFLGNAMHTAERENTYCQAFSDHQVAGLCLIGGPRTSEDWSLVGETLERSSIPLVVLDRLPPDSSASWLVVDNESGGFQATTHLLEHGHQSVACMSGPRGLSVTTARSEGWRRAHRTARCRVGPIVACSFDRFEAFRAARGLFERLSRPAALFVQSDEQAIGVLHAATALGIAVPDDVAIVSFDGIRDGALTTPPLTTVQQPFEESGRRAVEMLTEQIAGREAGVAKEVLEVSLTVRSSCGCRWSGHQEIGMSPPMRRPSKRGKR